MMYLPAMVMVGSGWKHSGKTELVCALMRHFSPELDIVGLKVSSPREQGHDSPHESPLLASEARTSFLLFEETARDTGTDTARMIASGARRAFFLRAGREQLDGGFSEFLERVGENAIIVCESNSLRHLVKPGIFLVIVRNDIADVKPSFTEVFDYADRIVHSDGARFDFKPGDICFQNGKWRFYP